MKYILRISTSLITFIIALNVTWAIYLVINQESFYETYKITCEKFCLVPKIKSLIKANPQGEVEVKFLGFKEIDEEFVAEVEVINNSPVALYYSAYGFDGVSPSIFKVDGILQPSSFCGTGLSTFHIHSGDSHRMNVSEFYIDPYYFDSDIDENLDLQIGYDFRLENKKKGKMYWSQSFQMPKALVNR